MKPPTTWAEFEKAMATLKANGVTPLAATIDGRWPGFIYFEEFLLRSNPGLYQRLMAGKAKYTDAGVVSAMKLWGRLIEQGYFTDPSAVTLGTGASNFTSYFKQGKVGMVQIGTWFEPHARGRRNEAGHRFRVVHHAEHQPTRSQGRGLRDRSARRRRARLEQGGRAEGARLLHVAAGPSDLGEGDRIRVAAHGRAVDVTGRPPAGRGDPEGRLHAVQSLLGGHAARHRRGRGRPVRQVHAEGGDPVPILQTIQKQADKTWSTTK